MEMIYEADVPVELTVDGDSLIVRAGRATFEFPMVFDGIIDDGERFIVRLIRKGVDKGEGM